MRTGINSKVQRSTVILFENRRSAASNCTEFPSRTSRTEFGLAKPDRNPLSSYNLTYR